MKGTGPVVIALAAAVLGFAIYGVAVNSPFTWIYVVVTVLLATVLASMHRAVQFPRPVLWGLVMAALGNLAGGILLIGGQPLYVLRLVGDLRYDKPYHFVATGIAAWASYSILAPRLAGRANHEGVGFLAVMVAAGAGALVEIVEYVGSVIVENANVGDYANNMLDLVANLAGAVLAVAVLMGRSRMRTAA